MKRLLCGLAAAVTLSGAISAAGTTRAVPVQVDGEPLDARCYLENGVTYVPLRGLLDAIGGWELRWDGAADRAVAEQAGNLLTASPAGDAITYNGRTYAGKVSLIGGRTYVPVRTAVGACGGSVAWDADMGGVSVTTEGAEYGAEDLYWLSRIISAESQGEPMEGQIAVGNVVLNRLRSPEFPDTVQGVVFDRQNGVQFEPVENGTVYLAPTPKALEAARRVLAGEIAVGDCLYFYAPALSPGTWINANRPYDTTIGCHRFYR